MISAELATEALIGDVRVGQNEINSVAVAGQMPTADCVGNDLLNLASPLKLFPTGGPRSRRFGAS